MSRYLLHIGPHKTGTTYLQHVFDRLRAQLADECAELQRETATPAEQGGMDEADRAGQHDGREVALAGLDADATRLSEVDAALQRIKDDTYGNCEESGEPIPVARLNALPWTRFCRAAAERRERAGQSEKAGNS